MDYIFTIIVNSFLLGTIIFFLVVISPSVFKTLNEKYSRKFLRFVFPRLFLFGFIVSTISIYTSYFEGLIFGLILSLLMSVGFFLNFYFLTPLINSKRELSLKGDELAKKIFKKLHFLSVLIFILQLFGTIIIIVFYIYVKYY